MGPPETRVTVSDGSRGGQPVGGAPRERGRAWRASGLNSARIRNCGRFSGPGRTTVWCVGGRPGGRRYGRESLWRAWFCKRDEASAPANGLNRLGCFRLRTLVASTMVRLRQVGGGDHATREREGPQEVCPSRARRPTAARNRTRAELANPAPILRPQT